ncbi:hypothetical protein [Actinomadura sp. 3N407]|uniref:hypothetical protein n=1 Tax=Actinomadura sp. 3N407 TaxID=3457423 RepID=UPI003FCCF423
MRRAPLPGLSLSAGQSSVGPRTDDRGCVPLPPVRDTGGGARVDQWDRLVDAQRRSEFSPRPGELGRALSEHDGCGTAVGPGAAIALARPDGTVERYSPAVGTAALDCPVTVVDGGQVVESGSGRLNSLAKVDAYAGASWNASPPPPPSSCRASPNHRAAPGVSRSVTVPIRLLPARPPWRVPLAVSLLTFTVLVVDAATGTLLHRAGPFGPSALYGGRYYGFGNSTFAVFSVAALVLSGAAAAELISRGRRRAATASVVAIGTVAVAVDTWPAWGADVGGGLALIPGVAVLAFAVAGIRLTPVRLLAVAASAVTVVAAVGVADWLRPPASRTHAGRFVQEILEGQAWQLVERKAGYAFSSLAGGPLAWGTAAVLVLLVLTLAWPHRFSPPYLDAAQREWPTLRPTLIATLTTCGVGAVVNDYGIRLITFGLITLLPLLAVSIAVVTISGLPEDRAHHDDHEDGGAGHPGALPPRRGPGR